MMCRSNIRRSPARAGCQHRGDTIARQFENRINYKRAIKDVDKSLPYGAEGIKSGWRTFGWCRIARSEEIKARTCAVAYVPGMDIDYTNVFA